MKHFNLEHFIADLQEDLQSITVANPNSRVNHDSKQLTSAFEFLLNKHAPLQPLYNLLNYLHQSIIENQDEN